ncbi:hypothetical protein [Parapedobacter tibetensis]|uniref:hypothetical protein n=1 Tax=Parapedobacter tibetensis TaxID=2972951 RepID=UPI00214D344C|nr:hypothetical protein [Parapedobacter tibetensis]
MMTKTRAAAITLLSLTLTTICVAQGNLFPTTGNAGVGTTSPETKLDVRGGLSVAGANPINGLNNFRNSIQIKSPSHGAIVYNPNEETELMFGFHSNGNFYWATGSAYVMQLSKTGDAKITNSLAVGGTLKPGAMLSVKGKIAAQEVEVTTSNWPDYVFDENYVVQPLSEIEAFIQKNKHLPGIPSKQEVEENGLNLGEMNRLLLEKVEILTLHLIKHGKEKADLQQQLDALKTEISDLKLLINK